MDFIIIFIGTYAVLLPPLMLVGYFAKTKLYRNPRAVAFVFLSLGLTYLLGLIARQAYFDPRPFVEQSIVPLIPHAADNGFPSDHVLLLAGIAAVLWPFSKPHSTSSGVIALAVGAARVFAGVHHWIDIVASILIALVATHLVQKLLHFNFHSLSRD